MAASTKVKNKKQIDRINELLYGDEGKYAFLFPNRDDVPTVTNHPFQDIVHDKRKADEFVIRAILDPEYIGWTVKSILNVSLFPMQLAILKTLWDHSFPMLIASRGSGKSFILAIYAIVKALLEPGSKIVIVGAGLRQAKLVFQYIEDIWSSAPVLRSIVGGGRKAGPKQSVDLCYFRVGESVIIAAPMGDGTKIRGLRAHCIIADEFASIPADVFDIVVRGFAATSKSPVEEAQKIVLDKKLAKAGVPKHVRDRLVGDTRGTNQIIYSGTAYYAFNHFAKRYEMWKNIIQSGGNRDIVADIFGGEDNIPEHFNWKDYAVIRLPHNCVQEGLLDQRQLAHAKATLPTNIYLMEYGACLTKDGVVDTRHGIRNITDISIGDLVLSHTGKYRRVLKKLYRNYSGKLIRLKFGVDDPIEVTAEHPIYTNEGFVSAKDLCCRHKFPLFGPQLSANTVFDLSEFNVDYRFQVVDGTEYIYTKWSSERKPKELQDEAYLKRRRYNQEYHSRKRTNPKYKSSVPRFVDANFDLGLILGVYAGDGDINKKDTQTNITWNAEETDKAKAFADAVKRVFGLNVTITNGKTRGYAVLRTHINNKIVCRFISGMIGKYSHDKSIKLLEQFTPEMACGFIKGYWMTDGTSLDNHTRHIGSVSRALIAQTRSLLLSLGCYSGIRHRPPKTSTTKYGQVISGGDSWLLTVPASFHNRLSEIFDSKTSYVGTVYVPLREYDEREYDGPVYNLEIEEDHSYLAQGVIHHNCFVADSDGIYKRSLIEACTTYPGKPITTPDGDIVFTPITRAQKGVKYVIGIDPAAERDNLAITIIEVWPNHWRIVYCWAVNKPEFEKRKKRGLVTNKDYYDYCCSRIRDVVKAFSPIRIEMDSQGGGYAIAEMLRNKKLLDPSKGDMPIYEVIDFDAPKAMDEERDGPHILHLIAQSTEWNSQSNLFMHKSFETKKLLFPGLNTVKMQAAMAIENLAGITVDTYEDIVHNIEELKNELCAIKMTSTPTGKEKFEAPSVTEISISEGKKKTHKMRKDRYTSLLIAHRYVYDNDITPPPPINYDDVPGNIRAVRVDPSEGMYRGPGIGGFRNADWARTSNVAAVKRGEVYNQ